MDIQIINRNFIQLGRIDEYESFIMTKSYGGIGGFEFHLDSNNIYANALVEENIIFTEEGKAYIILYRKRETDTNKLEIRGIELKGYLNRMLIFPPTEEANYRINSNAESIMKEYVEATLNRKNITNIEVAPNQNRGTSFSYQSRYKNLADELEKISLASGLGWDITLDMERKKFIFDVVEGRDITVNQDILPPAIFSVDYDNVGEQTLEESKLDYANVAIVAGQGEGVDREIYISGDLDGLDAIELFVDARDIENATDLPDRGIQKLKEVEKTLVFDSQVLTDKNLVYEEDYKLGDIATIQNADWDITVDRRITEITEIYEESGFRLDVTFGEGMPTLIDKIKQVTDIPIAENNVSTGETGDPGTPGKDGIGLNYKWNNTELGIKREDETLYNYTDLKGNDGYTPIKGVDYFDGDKGDAGKQGIQGFPGLNGRSLEYNWNGTQLGVRVEGETTYTYVNLKGDKGSQGVPGKDGEKGLQGERGIPGIQGEIGLTGATGKSIEYRWNGTQLGVRVEGESNYQYVNLKGEKGGQGPKGDPGENTALPSEWSNEVLQARDNSIGWEKNILFNADERYTVIEKNTRAAKIKEFFNGTLAPTNVPNISPDNPYVLEITDIPSVHTQGKAIIGWVSRFRYPTHFKIEVSDRGVWTTISDATNNTGTYYYSDKIRQTVDGIRFTIYEVSNMVDAYAQIAQLVFIHPEAAAMYDGLLAKTSEVIKTITSPSEPSNLKTGDQWHKEL